MTSASPPPQTQSAEDSSSSKQSISTETDSIEISNQEQDQPPQELYVPPVYCICHLPMEYCQFGPFWKSICKQYHAEFEKGNVIDDGPSRKAMKKSSKQPIKIMILKRNQKKKVTAIIGLDDHGYKLKDAAKSFGQKFSVGSGVVKPTPQINQLHIVLQGGFEDEMYDLLTGDYKIPEALIEVSHGKAKGRKRKPGGGRKKQRIIADV